MGKREIVEHFTRNIIGKVRRNKISAGQLAST